MPEHERPYYEFLLSPVIMALLLVCQYAVISPLCALPGLVFAAVFRRIAQYNFLYVYVQVTDSGGVFFLDFVNMALGGLVSANVVAVGVIFQRGSWRGIYDDPLSMVAALPIFATIYLWFWYFWGNSPDSPYNRSRRLSLERCVRHDHAVGDLGEAAGDRYLFVDPLLTSLMTRQRLLSDDS